MSNQSLYDFLAGHCQENTVRSYLEIGTRDGGSLRVVVENAPALESIVCADTWGGEWGGSGRGSHDHIDRLLAGMLYTGEVRYLDGDSKETIPTLAQQFDLILVDGDHSYEGGMADLRNVWPLCRPGGCVAFHDITHPAHPYLLTAFDEWVEERRPEIAVWRQVLEPYGVAVAVKR
jgi:predicted O-methyltransferase YrrM